MFYFLYLIAVLTLVAAFPRYQSDIPNGDRVPHPCRIGLWIGVGHFNANGTGPRNEFGLDFAAAGHVWTQTLCFQDSDKDGISNGEELGDPNCLWTKNSFDDFPAATTHPGICEPVDHPHCSWQAFTC
ncbi:unnamed protein product [Lymnaea stagnalis]|uniref:Temptin Cys/Cys disulfide domain-containing protein n=1 Tax=Lymnaea stagnalis TaxID=6523 RepID=A0AAV2HJH0_LYMST